jgi:hypothetical protein
MNFKLTRLIHAYRAIPEMFEIEIAVTRSEDDMESALVYVRLPAATAQSLTFAEIEIQAIARARALLGI